MKSFTIYEEYFDLIGLLSKRESEELSWAIWEYMFQDNIPKLNDKQMKVFNNLKRPLDKSKNKSKNTLKKNQNEIKLKSNQNQIDNQNKIKLKTHQDVNVYVNKKDRDRVIGEEEERILAFNDLHDIILTPNDYERLRYFIGKLDNDAIKDALLSGKGKSFNYTMSILRSRLQEQKNKPKSIVPEWLNKDLKNEEEDLTDEERRLIEEIKRA